MENENQGQWAIVELMGHKVVAGLASEVTMYGQPMLRVDVPETEGFSAFSQIYGGSAIYCMTPVSEEVARMAANRAKVNPISVYMPELITRQQYDKTVEEFRNRIDQLKGLPTPRSEDEGE